MFLAVAMTFLIMEWTDLIIPCIVGSSWIALFKVKVSNGRPLFYGIAKFFNTGHFFELRQTYARLCQTYPVLSGVKNLNKILKLPCTAPDWKILA